MPNHTGHETDSTMGVWRGRIADMATPATVDATTVSFFYVGLGVTVLIAAITIAGWKHKFLIWGLLVLGCILIGIGFAWQSLAPAVGNALAAFARADVAWFLAILASLGMVAFTQRRVMTSVRAAYDDTELRAEIGQLAASVAQAISRIGDIHERMTRLEASQKEIGDKLQGHAKVVERICWLHRADEARTVLQHVEANVTNAITSLNKVAAEGGELREKRHIRRQREGLERSLARVGLTISFSHERFDDNPYVPLDCEDGLRSEADKHEARRQMDEWKSALQSISQQANLVEMALERAKRFLVHQGAEVGDGKWLND